MVAHVRTAGRRVGVLAAAVLVSALGPAAFAAVINGTFPKAIRLEDYFPSELWPIEANPTQIHQVVLNLCVNARDAMPAGGTLRLRAENSTLDALAAAAIAGARPGLFVVLHVEDTGTGITPEVVARIPIGDLNSGEPPPICENISPT